MNDMTRSGFGDGSPVHMSSREIADLTGKQHAHVMRDVRVTLGELLGEEGLSKFGSSYLNAQNKAQPEYLLPKRECLILVSGYDVHLRARIIDRWQELEQRSPAAINVRNLPQLQTIALQLIEVNKEQSEQIAAMTPKVEAMALLESSEGSVGPRIAAKLLNQPEKKFTAWLQSNHWAFRQNGIGPLQAYADKRDAGYLEHRPHTFHDQVRGEDRTVPQLMITPKGLAKLAARFSEGRA